MAKVFEDIFLGLGSDLGDREGYLQQSVELIQRDIGPITRRSSVYETEPWGMKDTGPFLNQVIRVSSALSPQQLLTALQEIEEKLGRSRMPDTVYRMPEHGGSSEGLLHTAGIHAPGSGHASYRSRKLDIDILFYGEVIAAEPALAIPHPRIAERKFVLVPLAEIAETFRHPVSGKTVGELLAECRDHGEVVLWQTE